MQETAEHPQGQRDSSGVAQGVEDVITQPLENLNPLEAMTNGWSGALTRRRS